VSGDYRRLIRMLRTGKAKEIKDRMNAYPYEPYDDHLFSEDEDREDFEPRMEFAEPGGNSALRAETSSNPRNLPCPTCDAPNRLTPKDVDLGYQCNACADQQESGC